MLDIFKDDVTKQWSFGRMSAAATYLFCIANAVYSIFKTGVLPDMQSGWMSYILIAYGINKVSSTVKEVQSVGIPAT